MTVLVEACVTSLQEVGDAVAQGAHRLELCTALELDGLTPEPELLEGVLRRVAGTGIRPVPVFAMVRLAPGPHVCLQDGRPALLDAVRRCVGMGATGIVAGYLESESVHAGRGWPDVDLMARIVEVAAPAGVTFHKAFDQVRDLEAAAAALQDVGVARILTAGGPGRALDNPDPLRILVELQESGRGPDIIVAGGVRGSHVARLVSVTGARAVHARASAIPGIVAALRRSGG